MVAPLLNCVVTQNRKEAACVQENSYNLTNIVLSKDKLFFAIATKPKANCSTVITIKYLQVLLIKF